VGMCNGTGMPLTVSSRPSTGAAEDYKDHRIVNGIVVGLDAHAPRDDGELQERGKDLPNDLWQLEERQGHGEAGTKSDVWQPPWRREQRFPPKQEMQVSDCTRWCGGGAVWQCVARCVDDPRGFVGMCGVGSGGMAPVWTYWVMTASWWFEQACVMDVPLFSVAPGVSRARKSSAQATGDLAFVMNNP